MTFYYAARYGDGTPVRGAIEADNRDAALAHLRARALIVTLLESAVTARGAMARIAMMARRSSAARAAFFRSFATLSGAGIPLARVLDTLMAQCQNQNLLETLRSVAADVVAGTALSSAMGRHRDEFSSVAIAVVRAGELSGSLDESLCSLAELEEREAALRKRMWAALAYPLVVTLAAGGLVVFLVAQTMPSFSAMFEQMHVALPITTRLLIGIGDAACRPVAWLAAALTATAGIAVLRRYKTSDAAWAAMLDRARFRVPVVGAIAAKSLGLRFARTLGTLVRSGVDVVGAIEAAAGVVDGCRFRQGLRTIVDALRSGETLAEPLGASGLFDATFVQLVRAGEESGALDEMLLKIASYYELDVETSLSALSSVLEPLLICLLGAIVGTIVASVIIPLYSMIGSIK